MTALQLVAYILGGIFVVLWAVGIFIVTVIEQEEKTLRFVSGRSDMHVSGECNEEEEG